MGLIQVSTKKEVEDVKEGNDSFSVFVSRKDWVRLPGAIQLYAQFGSLQWKTPI